MHWDPWNIHKLLKEARLSVWDRTWDLQEPNHVSLVLITPRKFNTCFLYPLPQMCNSCYPCPLDSNCRCIACKQWFFAGLINEAIASRDTGFKELQNQFVAGIKMETEDTTMIHSFEPLLSTVQKSHWTLWPAFLTDPRGSLIQTRCLTLTFREAGHGPHIRGNTGRFLANQRQHLIN